MAVIPESFNFLILEQPLLHFLMSTADKWLWVDYPHSHPLSMRFLASYFHIWHQILARKFVNPGMFVCSFFSFPFHNFCTRKLHYISIIEDNLPVTAAVCNTDYLSMPLPQQYICKTQIDVQSLIDVQSSNWRPILKYMAVFHFLKSTFETMMGKDKTRFQMRGSWWQNAYVFIF